ncbi:hypothetical protein M514_22828 [Trichuris suis]|uniref:Uncharacterized protein n=1 Tax=Trichuris suis TaxID=68888 RepID=A0A085N683_9BILA|nr:hypothetical protein M513_13947 [Trichuris suis]KFD47573.1 hypothetical protein M513_11537 [Trichuris suis]KFD59488.1 hypothetical protein M514_28335 [Trichuris suis]KFD64979.1 hypothetical protein M514_22828 [Trichuris suis]
MLSRLNVLSRPNKECSLAIVSARKDVDEQCGRTEIADCPPSRAEVSQGREYERTNDRDRAPACLRISINAGLVLG